MSRTLNATAKNGIKSANDNIKPGEQLNVSAGIFMAFFGGALIKHYSEAAQKKEGKQNDKTLLHNK